ncbi:cupredoxin domain-containing protein [Streptomyces caatingaensis]|uniref:Plastocyanin n=1 Tax=Streptomyces caatingaensis TaxID=1678637 RepID=A0A0K9XI04_9ACTN|nr:cupredoxin domain-containing protein [Streptomyces caatingaensis]KNB52923.1 plastocyanin [Streptomyces caatingaensis]
MATHTVSIVDFAFRPDQLTIPFGDTVVWSDDGSTTHTVTADDGTFDSGDIAPGGTFALTFDRGRGTVAYHCSIHPDMRGAVTIT